MNLLHMYSLLRQRQDTLMSSLYGRRSLICIGHIIVRLDADRRMLLVAETNVLGDILQES